MRVVAAVLLACLLAAGTGLAQMPPRRPPVAAEGGVPNPTSQLPQGSATAALEQEFFALLRSGNVKKFLSYVPDDGVNVGKDAYHLTRAEVEEQLLQKHGLYCKLFDSSCIQSEIQLDASNLHPCSYRELLTKSKKVRTAATESTRNGLRQAFLVAEVKNENCAGLGLIDFIFNYGQGSWKLFSIP